MASVDDLRRTLRRIDGRGYKAYKDIAGSYDVGVFTVHIDHVQGDPFAAPSRMRVRAPQSAARIPNDLFENPVRRVALQDYLTREFGEAMRRTVKGHRGSGKSGLFSIDVGGQEVIERTSMAVNGAWVEARLRLSLPAAGRRVLGRQAEAMLCQELPGIAERSLLWSSLDQDEAGRFVECVENQEHIRGQLDGIGLVAFVGDGSILPRQSGASDKPMARERAVAFLSPGSMRVSIELPNPWNKGGMRTITGMGIPKGVNVIVGGGYHGKSTLLRALERGVYPHVPGDGREYVVACRDAVKIRAEDGRRVEQVDIQPFIGDLPRGGSTSAFSTDDASGSTSQAANIVEALEVGASALLLDEDTSATNFMVRDARMQALVRKEHEPITPFLDRVREFYDRFGVSTVLVMGGCGDYFDVADTVIMMQDYLPIDATREAREVATSHPTERRAETTEPMPIGEARVPLAESLDPSRGRRDVKIDAKGLDIIIFGRDAIDLRFVEQLVDVSQTRAVGHAIHLARERFMDGEATLGEVVESVERFFDENGLDALDPFHRGERHPGDFARPRKYEVAAAINRLRTVKMEQRTSTPGQQGRT